MMIDDDDDSQSVPMSTDSGPSLFGQTSNPFQNQNQNNNSPFQSNRGGRGGQTPRGRGRGRGNSNQDAMIIEDDTPPFQNNNSNTNNNTTFFGASRGGRGRGIQVPRGRGRGQNNFRGRDADMMIEDNGASSLFGNPTNNNSMMNQSPSNLFNKNPTNNNFKAKPPKTVFDFSGDVSMGGDAPDQYSPKKPMTRSRAKLFDANMNIEDQPPKPRLPMLNGPKKGIVKIPAKVNLFADRSQPVSPTNDNTMMPGNAPNKKTSNLFKINRGNDVDMNNDESIQQQPPQSRKQNSQQQQGLFNPNIQNKNYPLLTRSNNAPIQIDDDDENHVPVSPRGRGRFQQQQGDDDDYEKMSYQPMQQHQQWPQAQGRGQQSVGRGRGQQQQQQQQGVGRGQQGVGRGLQGVGRGQQGLARGQPVGKKEWLARQTMDRHNSYNNNDEYDEDEDEEQTQMSDWPAKTKPNQQQNLTRNKRMNDQQIQPGRPRRSSNNEEQGEMTYQSQIPLKRPRRAVASGQEDDENTGDDVSQKNAHKYQRGSMDNNVQMPQRIRVKEVKMPARRNSGQGNAVSHGKYVDQEEEVDEEYEDPEDFQITRTISNNDNEDEESQTQTLTRRGDRFAKNNNDGGATNYQLPSQGRRQPNNNYDKNVSTRANKPEAGQIAADLAKKRADILELKQRISSQSARTTKAKKLVPSRAVQDLGEGHEKPLVGTCTTMCPVKEMNMRTESKNLQFYERLRGTENHPLPQTNLQTCVKEFKKIDAIVGVEADQLRTMETLQETMSYLLHVALADDRLDLPYYLLYGFICDRIRSVIQDATVQHFPQTYTLASLEIFQKAVRFYILSDQMLCTDSADNFDPKLQKERLNKALISINEHCTILRAQHIYTPDEPEFTAYLMLLSDHENHLKQIWGAPTHIAQSEVVKFVIKVKNAISSNNYVAFFKLFNEADIVIASLMHNWIEKVRRRAFESLFKMKILEVSFVTRVLNFESTEETLGFLCHFGIEPNDGIIDFTKINTNFGDVEPYPRSRCQRLVDQIEGPELIKLIDSPLLIRMNKEEEYKKYQELCKQISESERAAINLTDDSHHYIYEKHEESEEEHDNEENQEYEEDEDEHYDEENHDELEGFQIRVRHSDDDEHEEHGEDVGEKGDEDYYEEDEGEYEHHEDQEEEEYDQTDELQQQEYDEDEEHETDAQEYDDHGNPYPADGGDDTHVQYDDDGNPIEGEEDEEGYEEGDAYENEEEAGEEDGEHDNEEYENEEYDESQVQYDEDGEPIHDENDNEHYDEEEAAEYENEEDGEHDDENYDENAEEYEEEPFNNPLFNTSKTVSTPVIGIPTSSNNSLYDNQRMIQDLTKSPSITSFPPKDTIVFEKPDSTKQSPNTLSTKQERELHFQRVFSDAMVLIHSARSKYLAIQYAEIWRDKTKRMIPLWRQRESQEKYEEEENLIKYQRALFQKNQEEKLAKEEYEKEMKEIEELAKLQVSGEYFEVSCPRTLKDIQKEFSKQYLISDTYLKWSMEQNQIHINFLAEYQSKPQRFYSPVLFKKEDYKK
jgi:hypothetical protein